MEALELMLEVVPTEAEEAKAKEAEARKRYEAYRRVLDAYDMYVLKTKPVRVAA